MAYGIVHHIQGGSQAQYKAAIAVTHPRQRQSTQGENLPRGRKRRPLKSTSF